MVLLLDITASGLHNIRLVFTLKELVHVAFFLSLSFKGTVIGVLFLLLSDHCLEALHLVVNGLNGLHGGIQAILSGKFFGKIVAQRI